MKRLYTRASNLLLNFLSFFFLYCVLLVKYPINIRRTKKKLTNIKNVAWFGAYGNGNIGDDLIFYSLKRLLFKKNIKINLSIRNLNFSRNYGCETFQKGEQLYDFWRYIKIVRNSDIVVLGGGGLFEFYYPSWPAFRMVVIYLCPLIIAFIFNKPSIIVGVGVNNYKHTNLLIRLMFRLTLNTTCKILTRDQKSKDGLIKNRINTNIKSTFDPVLSLDYLHEKRDFVENKSKKKIGVLLWPYFLWPHFYDNSRKIPNEKILKHKKLVNEWRKLENSLMKDFEFIYLTFHFSDVLLYKELGVEYIESSNLGSFYKGIMDVDMIISMRYHGIITSINFGKPVISINVQEKMWAIMEEFNMEKFQSSVEDFKSENILKVIDYVFENYSDITKDLANNKTRIREQLLKSYKL